MEDIKEYFLQIKRKIVDNKTVSIAIAICFIVLIVAIVFVSGINNSKVKQTASGNSIATSNMTTHEPTDDINQNGLTSVSPTSTPCNTSIPTQSKLPEVSAPVTSEMPKVSGSPVSTEISATSSASTKPQTKKPAVKTSKPVDSSDAFTFKYYSSTASDVYITGELNNWQPFSMKMEKNGNWFTKKVRLNKNIEYNFVDGTEVRLDPFCREFRSDKSYVDVSVKKNSNYDGKIKPYTSTHFDYFTTGKDKTSRLETIYSSLKGRIIKYMSPATKKNKIRYYGVDYRSKTSNSMFNGTTPFAFYDTSEVFDQMD